MLSSVTLYCQVTMIVKNSNSLLSEMSTISHKLTSHGMCFSWYLYLSLLFDQVMSPHHSGQMSQGHKALGSLFEGVIRLYLSLSLSLSLYLILFVLCSKIKSVTQWVSDWLHYWLKWSIGFWNVQKVDKSRQLFLIQKTHQVIFAACFELVMTHILRRKKSDDVDMG